MTDCVLSTRRQLELMQQLQQAADARAQAEAVAAETLAAELATVQADFDAAAAKLHQTHAAARRELENDYGAAKQSAAAEAEAQQQRCREQFDKLQQQINGRYKEVVAEAEHRESEAKWQAMSVFDASKDQPRQSLETAQKRIDGQARQIEGLERDAIALMAMRGLATAAARIMEDRVSTPPVDPTEGTTDFQQDLLQESVVELRRKVLDLQAQKTASLFLEGARPWAWFVPAAAAAALPAFFAGGGDVGLTLAAALGGGAVLGGMLLAAMRPRGRRQSLELFSQIVEHIDKSKVLEQSARRLASRLCDEQTTAIAQTRNADVSAADQNCREAIADIERWQTAELQRIADEKDERLQRIAAQQSGALAAADQKFPPLLEDNAAHQTAAEQANIEQSKQRREAAHAAHGAAWRELADRWLSSYRDIAEELAAIETTCQALFPNWEATSLDAYNRPSEPPAAIQFGCCNLPLKVVRNGWPEDPRLQPSGRQLTLPAMMTLDEQPRVVATVAGIGRRIAVDVLQLLMLRFLTAMPAGKVRFTIIDPAGLGENFAPFTHLADHDEQLLGGQIWTDSKQIDRRLTLLNEHMENVLQKYLRNEFATLHEYNQSAGEVAEPYHMVVVANFPHGFNDAAARKLASISKSGPRCGVYVLTTVDTSLRMPHEFELADLLQDAVHLDWQQEKLIWKYPLFERLPLSLDPLPSRQQLNEVLAAAGEASREASRVEVPFALVAPEPNDVWLQNSAATVAAPIGRAGARRLQSLELGRGTSQHVLISGKTGSGKSTLLHALITNLALHYAPDQLEFYLVDFKKGVEFRTYAAQQLPHARVIAIESEREFGVSVLQRLDEELSRRGELFRDIGVQDLAGLRRAAPDEVMPRTLLIIDEFQELFVSDDKLAQDAALLLDRLVRQGRAFGMHVLLGSQTLAGAYSLARSTLGQMAVRIALECSDADAHLILSDDNTAARLLSRPGEAIYNDENGLVAGNHPFQVVWLPDQQRKQYLVDLASRPLTPAQTFDPAIVFEGNVPADPLGNPSLLAAYADPEKATAEPTVWLGSAVRIEPPTHFVLRRQGGHNCAIVGGDEPLALGCLTAAVAAVAAQQQDMDVRFLVLNGCRPESPDREVWTDFAAAVGQPLTLVTPREAAAEINRLADCLADRQKAADESHAPIYLVIHDLAQFRDLRQSDDEFSFSFSASGNGAPPPVDRRFRELLKEGPALGIHTLLWCESYNSLTRAIDRLSLREIEFRVALQMSAADSTSFIDSPSAGRLGEHRAILYRDDLGTQTKFRPYGRPSEAWLEAIRMVAGNAAASR